MEPDTIRIDFHHASVTIADSEITCVLFCSFFPPLNRRLVYEGSFKMIKLYSETTHEKKNKIMGYLLLFFMIRGTIYNYIINTYI